jgi:iron only hydrogenase large subunit-like protein
VCYAEKTSPQALPYIGTGKSAQQVIGSIIKHPMGSRHLDTGGADVYHVAVMPCFDKKLEATRRDFFHEDLNVNEVDLVLSTVELINFLISVGNVSASPAPAASATGAAEPPPPPAAPVSEQLSRVVREFKANASAPLDPLGGTGFIESLFRCASADGSKLVAAADANAGSGAYMEYLFRFGNEKLNGLNLWNTPLEYKAGRNEDISEISNDFLPEGAVKLSFAKAYGFRNIQSVMMKMKTKRCKLDFVEIMACPKGCVNGGGQFKAVDRETPPEINARVAGVSAQLESVTSRRPEDSPLVRWLYGPEALATQPCSAAAMNVLHTRYHAIPKLEQIAPLVAKW